MKKSFSLIVIILVFSASAHSFDKAKLNQYLNTLEANDKAMLSVAVVKNGEPIYQKSIGFADIDSQQKANKDTQYHIGSITKVYTATMIFQLIDEGKLSLETKLAKFYPNVKNANEITISMLLNHRSGIHNFTNLPDYTQYMTQPKSKSEMIKLLESLDSDFKPDSNASYSNSAYVLLGFILEDITESTYAKQLKIRITDKLNLNRTVYGDQINIASNQSNSYTPIASGWVPATVTDMSIPHSAGAIISTPTEVGMFLTDLLNGKLISADSLAQMQQINQGYGRGLFKFPFHQKTLFGHTGGIDGFRSQTGYLESDNVAFTITANALDYALNDISIGVLSVFYDLPFDIPDFDLKPIDLPENQLGKYQGVFESQQLPLKITIKVNGKHLTAQATGQGPLTLTPFSTNEFRFAPAGIVIIFGGDGENVDYSTFQLKQGGGIFSFTKK